MLFISNHSFIIIHMTLLHNHQQPHELIPNRKMQISFPRVFDTCVASASLQSPLQEKAGEDDDPPSLHMGNFGDLRANGRGRALGL